jgi:hypothetical protein
MTFRTRYNHFEYVVMPFGLANALIVFQHMMNDVFSEYLDDFMVCYIDDIFIFLKSMTDHEHHVCFVLEKLRKVGLYAKMEKYGFHLFEVEFVGYIISRDGISMDLCKVQNHYGLGYPNFCSGCSMFFWVCQFLSIIHCTLFHDNDPSY